MPVRLDITRSVKQVEEARPAQVEESRVSLFWKRISALPTLLYQDPHKHPRSSSDD